VIADPGVDVGLREGGRHYQEPIEREASNGQICLNPAAWIQELRVDTAPNCYVKIGGRNPVKYLHGISTLHEKLRERRLAQERIVPLE